jgi:Zn-dependent protease
MQIQPAESSPPEHPTRRGPPGTFSLLGVPIRVASSFWIIAFLFGMSGAGASANAVRGFVNALAWTTIVFVSIVLHELGHALTARAFGARPAITLHGMGGLTHFEGARITRSQSCLISFAGPAVGLVLGLALYAATRGQTLGPDAHEMVVTILWVNIGWSIINLLPVVPFDGGHIMAAFLGPRHVLSAALVSAVVGSMVAVWGLGNQLYWIALLFGSATVSAIRQVRRLWSGRADWKAGLEADVARARLGIARGDAEEVLALSQNIVARARSPLTKNAGLLSLAWAHATLGRAVAARELVEKMDRSVPSDSYLLAALEDALGSPERARARLEAERLQGVKQAASIKLLIDLYARDGQLSRAVELATEELETLGRDDARAVLSAALAQGAYVAAAALAARLVEVYGDPSDDEARALAHAGDPTKAVDRDS